MRPFSKPWRSDDDAGYVMIAVIAGTIVAMLLVLTGLAAAVQTQHESRRSQDWNAALSAAQAGIDDYIAHLNRNDNYARSWDCTNTAMIGPGEPASNTCGWTSSTVQQWVPVNGTGSNGPEYHYDIDPSTLDSQGTVTVTSTGQSNGVSRTLQAAVSRGGSTQFLYYTDHEDADPGNALIYPYGMPSNCAYYWWNGRSSNDRGCQEITFVGGDVLDGPVHTNDTPLMTNLNGLQPEFKQGLETSDPACQSRVIGQPTTYKYCDRTHNGANYDSPYYPSWAGTDYLPDNSDQFKTYPGCDYTGSTRILFNNDGTMTVWSEDSSTTATLPTSAACGGGNAGLTNGTGVTVNVPTDKVIYVENAPSSQQHLCTSGEIGGPSTAKLPLGNYQASTSQTSFTYDTTFWNNPDQICGTGNVYIQGTLKGRVTVAAQNDVVVTGDLTLAGGLTGSDLMGLVASNSVEVMHPMLGTYKCTSYSGGSYGGWWGGGGTSSTCRGTGSNYYGLSGSASEASGWPQEATSGDLQIDASIQTLQHSFWVQNYNQGSDMGKLTVWGSIAQKWRGIVGQSGYYGSVTGFLKDYHYDKRLKFESPPYFPQFTNAVWSVKYEGETS